MPKPTRTGSTKSRPDDAPQLVFPPARQLRKLAVVIPARDEAGCIASTVEHPHGFGRAVQCGLNAMTADAVVVMMADESDDCRDVVRYWRLLQQGNDCVFGSRFIRGGGVIDYPRIKYMLNRMANLFIRIVFGIGLNDTTNAFKAYRREVIEGCRPFLSPHFNLTVELPLKAIVRGYSWTTMPITWRNRKTGIAKLKIGEMGSRYFFIVAYVWLEKYFSRGDYFRQAEPAGGEGSTAKAA